MASPIRKHVFKTVLDERPMIGERSRTGVGNGDRTIGVEISRALELLVEARIRVIFVTGETNCFETRREWSVMLLFSSTAKVLGLGGSDRVNGSSSQLEIAGAIDLSVELLVNMSQVLDVSVRKSSSVISSRKSSSSAAMPSTQRSLGVNKESSRSSVSYAMLWLSAWVSVGDIFEVSPRAFFSVHVCESKSQPAVCAL